MSNSLNCLLMIEPMPKKPLTKASLLKAIDEKLQALNLLRSALQADPSRKKEDLVNYQKHFEKMFNK